MTQTKCKCGHDIQSDGKKWYHEISINNGMALALVVECDCGCCTNPQPEE